MPEPKAKVRRKNFSARHWKIILVQCAVIKKHPIAERKLKTVTAEHLQAFLDLLTFGGEFPDGKVRKEYSKDYIRYTHASCQSYVVVNIDGKILVANGENDAETKEIYQRISEKVSKERK